MNVVDSSGWIEYLVDGPGARHFSDALRRTSDLIVPSIAVMEVMRYFLQRRGDQDALEVVSGMQEAAVIELDFPLAVRAARLGIQWKLPSADSIILATAEAFGATLWTQDADFERVPGVKFFPKK